MPAHSPTAYPDVNELLSTLLSGIRSILGDQFAGMYLHGSLALGDFDPGRSDVDYLVVTDGVLPPEKVSALAAMHAQIAAGDLSWKTNYEGSYIPRQAIRRYDPADCLHPAIDVDGNFGLDRHDQAWVIQRHVIREHGIALSGPAPQSLIDPISPDDLRRAAAAVLRAWWEPMLENPARLQSSEYQAYAVLTMCRAIYTLLFGAVVTKPQAAGWVKTAFGGRWAGLIDTALSWRHGVELDITAEALAFIRFTLARAVLHTPEEVLRHAAAGRLEEWIHSYLTTAGYNQGLSAGLKLQPRYWIGPVLVPLERLERCSGPEPAMEYVDDPVRWEERMAAMTASLARGWAPPPLIAQFTGERFSIRDGNHRHEALRRAGRNVYWCVIWCDSEPMQAQARERLCDVLPPSD